MMNEIALDSDLLKVEWIKHKCRSNPIYAQNLYAAMCNNRFFKDDKEWTASWRESGAIVADLIGEGDYLDWYCSGNEGEVTPEITNDLLNLGWTHRPYEPRLKPGLYRNDWK